nr:toll/interleukin-1 receptor domain-containing protein [Anaerolineae bacterium]
MTAPKQHDVFLSYKREDSDIMARIRDALRADGVVVWTDEYIEVAEYDVWEKSIRAALKAS